ncbi:MAG: NnrS family protein [Roseibium sp.]
MVMWSIWLGVHAGGGAFVAIPMSMAPHLWHAHEMMFGYTIAVMAGFFVTAVPNWTGTTEAGAKFVILSGSVWMLGRLAVWFSGLLDPLLVAVIDLSFIPILSTAIIGRLAQKSQVRNMVFLALLTALFAGNLLMHLDWIGWADGTAEIGVRLGILTSAPMIVIIGGRVVPAFTRNALNRENYKGGLPRSFVWLDRASILLALLTAVASLPFVPDQVFGSICLAAGTTNLARLFFWKGLATLGNPIVWILHAAFLLLCAGYLGYGIAVLFDSISPVAALHLIAAGAIGSMTLAMMTRASLGHSGRSLHVSGTIVAAYLSVITAALIRALGTLYWDYFPVMLVSGGFWTLGFGLFVLVYAPILSQPRVSR